MKRLLDWVQGFALALGGPGVFLIAFLDSSFLSFPEVVDLLIIWLTIQHPPRMIYYALLATLGSIAGCLFSFVIARKGGDAFLRRRLHERHIERATGVVRKYGLLSVLVPSLLPPPAPFKIFVLAAGVAQVRVVDFVLAVTIGRGLRCPSARAPRAVVAELLRDHARKWRRGWPAPRSCSGWAGSSGSAVAARPVRPAPTACPAIIDGIRGSHL